MTAVPFDTLKLATKLEATGFTPEQARGVSSALAESFDGSNLVTKADIAPLATKAELREAAAELREAIADFKVDIVRWLVLTQLALGGFIFAALKLVK
jgi:hypothetical protein